MIAWDCPMSRSRSPAPATSTAFRTASVAIAPAVSRSACRDQGVRMQCERPADPADVSGLPGVVAGPGHHRRSDPRRHRRARADGDRPAGQHARRRRPLRIRGRLGHVRPARSQPADVGRSRLHHRAGAGGRRRPRWRPSGTPRYTDLSSFVALMVGALVIAVGLLRLGWIAQFLSTPVVTGILAGIAIEIVVRQLPAILGLAGGGTTTVGRVRKVVDQIGHANGWSLAIAVVGPWPDRGGRTGQPSHPRRTRRPGHLDRGGRRLQPRVPRGQGARLDPRRTRPPSGCRQPRWPISAACSPRR